MDITSDCVEDGYGGGRGPLDNMRALEHYLPDHQNQSKGRTGHSRSVYIWTERSKSKTAYFVCSGLHLFGNNVMKGKALLRWLRNFGIFNLFVSGLKAFVLCLTRHRSMLNITLYSF